MNKKPLLYYLISALLLLTCSYACSPNEQLPQQKTVLVDKTQQALQDMNRYLSEREYDVLQAYINRQGFKMQQSQYGFYVEQVEQGSGRACKQRDFVTLQGRVWLIDGTLCYTYTEAEPLQIHVGAEVRYRILNLAMLGLKKGAKVRLLFPSMMVFGLLGDGDKIPPKSPLLCEFTLVDMIQK
ncbi:MAG: FKBP-type peptidyl-prolyl cis-trans isomerase [Bacteroidales bacterium]